MTRVTLDSNIYLSALVFGTIAVFTNHVTPVEAIDAVPSDPDDNQVLECALAAGSEVIVSGDSDLLSLGSFRGINVVRAAEFLAQFSARRR